MTVRLAQATELIAAGRYDQALKLLADSDDPARHALLGAAYLGRRKAAPALTHLGLAIADDPGDLRLQLALAKAHLLNLDAPQAVALLEPLRQHDLPELPELLASAYRHDARFEDAVKIAGTVAAPSPSLLYEQAFSLLMLGEDRRSLDVFDQLLEKAPSHAAGWFWSHAPALDLSGWSEAESRLIRAAMIPGANRKYQAILAGYDLLRAAADPRPCPIAFRHIGEGASALLPHYAAPPKLFGVPANLLRWALAQAGSDGLICEFGVRRGNSLRQLAAATTQPLHGFDSFIGLPEAWVQAPAGVLTAQGDLPAMPAHVSLHQGWFEQSLPNFLETHPGPLSFANIDCDIYSSTRTVLWALAERITAGTILVFDELIGNRSWARDEFRALNEFSQNFSRDYAVLAVNLSGKQVCVRIV